MLSPTNWPIEIDRPGTSATGKRAVRTQQASRGVNLQSFEQPPRTVTSKGGARPVTNHSAFTSAKILEERGTKQAQRQNIMRTTKNVGLVKPSSQSYKTIPKQIPYDTERLYEELIEARVTINQLQMENTKLKTKNKIQEEALKNRNNVQSLHNSYVNTMEAFYSEERPPQVAPKEHIVGELRNVIREQKREIERKDEALKSLKKNANLSKLNELDVELETYRQESMRLKQMLAQAMTIQFQEIEMINSTGSSQQIIQTLKEDNIEMAALLKNMGQEVKDLQLRLKRSESHRNKATKTNEGLQRIIGELQKQIEQLKLRDPFLQVKKSQNNNAERQMQIELDKHINECNQLNNALVKKEKRVSELERRVKELQSQFQEQQQQFDIEKAYLRASYRDDSSGVNSTTNKRRLNLQSSSFYEERNEPRRQTMVQISERGDMQDAASPLETMKRPVEKAEVIDIGQKLKFTMLNLRLPMNELDQYLSTESGTVSLEELDKCLQKLPFSLNKAESLLMARYMTEDSEQRLIRFNFKVESSLARVRSILRNLMDNYEVISTTGEESLVEQIAQQLWKHKAQLYDAIAKVKAGHHKELPDGLCPITDFVEALQILEIHLTQKQITLIQQKNYQMISDLHNIDFNCLYQIFKTESPYSKDHSHQKSEVSNQSVSEAKPNLEQLVADPKTKDLSSSKQQVLSVGGKFQPSQPPTPKKQSIVTQESPNRIENSQHNPTLNLQPESVVHKETIEEPKQQEQSEIVQHASQHSDHSGFEEEQESYQQDNNHHEGNFEQSEEHPDFQGSYDGIEGSYDKNDQQDPEYGDQDNSPTQAIEE